MRGAWGERPQESAGQVDVDLKVGVFLPHELKCQSGVTALGVRVFLRRATASEKDVIVVAASRQLVKRHTILGKAALDESEVGRGELLPSRIAGVFYEAFNYFGRWSQAMTGVFARILTNPVRPRVPRSVA